MAVNKELAIERVNKLFQEAKEAAVESPKLAKRYVEIARKICGKARTGMPRRYKRAFCKRCNSYLIPGKNCRVRMKKKLLIVNCGVCKKVTRIGIE